MILLTYHNLDADHSHYLFDDTKKAIQYALDEIKHYDETDGVVHDEQDGVIVITADGNEAIYTVREISEINPTFTVK